MNNIFENAKFGDKFRTRDGRMAIYHRKKLTRILGKGLTEVFILISDKLGREIICYDNGMEGSFEDVNDIIGKWQEPINEEELDKLAVDDIFKVLNSDYFDGKISFNKLKEIYKAGYRKAMEE